MFYACFSNRTTQEWIALYEEKTGKTLQPAQIERILIDVGVYRENLLRIKIQEVVKGYLDPKEIKVKNKKEIIKTYRRVIKNG